MKRVLVISERDNVATALETLEPDQRVELGSRAVGVAERVPSGHKIALVDIPAGEPVVKYGSPIGHATVDIRQGTHVHTHNVSSARGRGDLGGAGNESRLARLAEPPDAEDMVPSESPSAAGRASGGGAPRADKK